MAAVVYNTSPFDSYDVSDQSLWRRLNPEKIFEELKACPREVSVGTSQLSYDRVHVKGRYSFVPLSYTVQPRYFIS